MADTVIASTATINGRQYKRSATRTDDGLVEKVKPAVAAAKAGQLTTRGSDTAGTLTMGGGHGITTGARLDLYWTGGSRRGITVGTVSGTSVPISGGAGDNLPTNLTSIIAAVPVEEAFPLDGDEAVVLGAYAGARGQVVFADDADAELLHIPFASAGGYWWDEDGGITNPLAAAAVAKVFFSHADTTTTREMRAVGVFA